MQKIWKSKDLERMLEPNDWLRLQQQSQSRRATELEPIATASKSRLYPLDNVRGVLFDVYGTLLISEAGEILCSQLAEALPQDIDSSTFEDSPKEILTDTAKGAGTRKQTSMQATPEQKTRPQAAATKTSSAAPRTAAGPDSPAQQALLCLPELLRNSLPADFEPQRLLQESILREHRRRSSIQYPEVDIVSLWHQIFLSQLDEDMHTNLNPFMLARFILEYELLCNRVQLMPGALELLDWLAKREFHVGIISNAQFYTPIILAALLGVCDLGEMNIRADLCFWSYQHGCSKPQAKLFRAARSALAQYDLDAQEVLYLGNDMRNDVWGAAQAGFVSALFAGDQRSLRLRSELPEIADTEADIVVTELGQLKGIL